MASAHAQTPVAIQEKNKQLLIQLGKATLNTFKKLGGRVLTLMLEITGLRHTSKVQIETSEPVFGFTLEKLI